MSSEERVDWEEFGRDIADKVVSAVEHYCTEVSDDPLECLTIRADESLYDLAEEFAGSSSDITEEDLELLRQMPEDVYEKYSEHVGREIEDILRATEREVEDLCRTECQHSCHGDEDCIDRCVEECVQEAYSV